MAARPPDPPGSEPNPTDQDHALDETGRIEETRHLPPAPVPAPRRPEPPPARAARQTGSAPAPPRTRSSAASAGPALPQAPYPLQQAVPQAPARRRSPASSGWYLPWWSLVVLVLAVAGIALVLVIALSQFSAPNTPGNQPAQVRMVTSMPTLSQDFLGAPVRNPGPAASTPIGIPAGGAAASPELPTPAPRPSLPPGDFQIGATVRVVGVGGSGLNVRPEPGTSSNARFLAYDDDEFVLVDGPQTVNNLEWWRIEDPDDANRYGWAARNYLTVISP